MAYRLGHFGTKKSLFIFDEPQKAALFDLWAELERESGPINSNILLKLFDLFDTLYFPETPMNATNVFVSPIMVFIALECLNGDGTYRSIFHIPPVIAKVQYSIRLRACHKFLKWFEEGNDDETTFK